jgi:hypothetical protein
MFHVKHFGTIEVGAKALLLRGGWYEAGIRHERMFAIGFTLGRGCLPGQTIVATCRGADAKIFLRSARKSNRPKSINVPRFSHGPRDIKDDSHCLKLDELMPSFDVPTPTNPVRITVDAGGSLVLLGANGAGKTRLGAMIEQTLGANSEVHRIGAHRSLAMNTEVQAPGYEIAERRLFYGHD